MDFDVISNGPDAELPVTVRHSPTGRILTPAGEWAVPTATNLSTEDVDRASVDPSTRLFRQMRPDAGSGGRYHLPDPDTRKIRTWQRVTNFVKMTDDTYHLELWKQRNVAVGISLLIQDGKLDTEILAGLNVKTDKQHIANIVERAIERAGAHVNRDEGSALHKSTELVDYANGDLSAAPKRHESFMRLYRDGLRASGLTVLRPLIERVTVSKRYDVAGKFDRIFREADGSYVLADIKTGDSIDLAKAAIASQLEAYRDGINTHGIFNGHGYDKRIKVRDDYAIVVHLPSTREGEISFHKFHYVKGKAVSEANVVVRDTRRIKGISEPYVLALPDSQDAQDQYWLERLNGAQTYAAMVQVAESARSFGQWNDRLSAQARIIAAELDVI